MRRRSIKASWRTAGIGLLVILGSGWAAAMDVDALKTWGGNSLGQLGDNTNVDRSFPQTVFSSNMLLSAKGGGGHSLLLQSDGSVKAWGCNTSGQLGDGTTLGQSFPVMVPGLSGVAGIAAGGAHSLALTGSGTVMAWGGNSQGQLGLGTTSDTLTPTMISGLFNVTSIAAGEGHSLALTMSGGVMAWGNNDEGELGNSDNTDSTTSVSVFNISTAIAVAAGGTHSLALDSDGTVWSWGGNSYGQLGDGTTTNTNVPNTVSGVTNIIAIAAGANHTLALDGSGTLYAWGDNYYGQLGDGTTTSSSIPVTVSGLSGVVQIAAGGNYSLAMLSDGTVWAWGDNTYGQLGDGTTVNQLTPVTIPGLDNVYWLAAGLTHSLILSILPEVSVYATDDYSAEDAFGAQIPVAAKRRISSSGPSNTGEFTISRTGQTNWPLTVSFSFSGTATDTDYTASEYSLVTIPAGLSDVTITISPTTDYYVEGEELVALSLDPSSEYSFSTDSYALVTIGDGTTSADLLACGDNTTGQLGDSTVTSHNAPILVPGVGGLSGIACGQAFSLGLLANGTVLAWGMNSSGQLGDGGVVDMHSPTLIGSLAQVKAIAAGSTHALALLDDGTLISWGEGSSGQLGNGSLANASPGTLPNQPETMPISIAAGGIHSLLACNDGSVWSWGDNTYGQLGDGGTSNQVEPVQVMNINTAIAVAAGSDHSLALLADGKVMAWGRNAQGQLGEGTLFDRSVPVLVLGLANAKAIAAGDGFSMALLTDGTVKAWGANTFGQLGDGTTTERHLPVSVSGLSNVTSIAAGQRHALALLTDNTVKAWGDNTYGALGDGTNVSHSSPVTIPAYTGAQALAAGGYHTLAIRMVTVSVEATDPAAGESGANLGTFTVTRSGPTDDPLIVNISLSGTAGVDDYEEYGQTEVFIDAGYSSATADITPLTDELVEGDETVVLNVLSGSGYLVGAVSSATVTITDGTVPPPPAVQVSVTASDAAAAEGGADTGTFVVTRTGSAAGSLTVGFGLSGTAGGSDYTASASSSVTIPDGSYSATVTITPVADSLVEGDETVILSLVIGAGYEVGSSASATVTIADAPKVSVAASDAAGSEVQNQDGQTDPAVFTISRSGSTTAPLTVAFSLSGTAGGADYSASAGASVTIPAGSANATMTITPLVDLLIEGEETVILTLATSPAYILGSASATVTITDAPVKAKVSVAASGSPAEDGAVPGVFIITRTGDLSQDLSVSFSLGGTAGGEDYTASAVGSVVIPAGVDSATVTITPRADLLTEGDETVSLALAAGAEYALGSAVTAELIIVDAAAKNLVSVSGGGVAYEAGPVSGTFVISRQGDLTAPLTVNFALSGSADGADYSASATGAVEIPAGSSSAAVTITPQPDLLIEDDETVVLSLAAGEGYVVDQPATASLVIADQPPPVVVSVVAADSAAAELGSDPGSFTIIRTGDLTEPLTVNFTLGGTAGSSDYRASDHFSATIPAGQDGVLVVVTPKPDDEVEGDETVDLRLASGTGYGIGSPASATLIIADNPAGDSAIKFVKRMYLQLLYRPATTGEIGTWADSLRSGEAKGAQLVREIVLGSEFVHLRLDEARFMDRLFLALFDRRCDVAGRNAGRAAIAAGTSRAKLLETYLVAIEFQTLCARYGINAN